MSKNHIFMYKLLIIVTICDMHIIHLHIYDCNEKTFRLYQHKDSSCCAPPVVYYMQNALSYQHIMCI